MTVTIVNFSLSMSSIHVQDGRNTNTNVCPSECIAIALCLACVYLGACVQCVWEQWRGGGQRLLQPGLPAAAYSVSALPWGPGQRGGGGEQSVLLLLEGSVHGPISQVRVG